MDTQEIAPLFLAAYHLGTRGLSWAETRLRLETTSGDLDSLPALDRAEAKHGWLQGKCDWVAYVQDMENGVL